MRPRRAPACAQALGDAAGVHAPRRALLPCSLPCSMSPFNASGAERALDTTILLFLLQDGITNGAIYALLALALVLVFAVTRVILVPQGEFVTYGALTLAMLDLGQRAGHRRAARRVRRLALVVEVWSERRRFTAASSSRAACSCSMCCRRSIIVALTLVACAAAARGAAAGAARHRHRRADGTLPLPHRLPAAGGSLRPRAADRRGRRALLDDRAVPAVLRAGRPARAGRCSPRGFTAGPLPGLRPEHRHLPRRARPDAGALSLLRPHHPRQGAARDRRQPARRAPRRRAHGAVGPARLPDRRRHRRAVGRADRAGHDRSTTTPAS